MDFINSNCFDRLSYAYVVSLNYLVPLKASAP